MIVCPHYSRALDNHALECCDEQTELYLPIRPEVRVADICQAVVAGTVGKCRLVDMRFGHPSRFPRAPIFNVLSEGRDCRRDQRCLVPVSAFFDFTVSPNVKTTAKDRWRVSRSDGAIIGLPAIWKPQGDQPPSFTLMTTWPGPDLQSTRNRHLVVLEPAQWRGWLLDGDKAGFGPSPAGTFIRTMDRVAGNSGDFPPSRVQPKPAP